LKIPKFPKNTSCLEFSGLPKGAKRRRRTLKHTKFTGRLEPKTPKPIKFVKFKVSLLENIF
jgi:hypothetical protein